MFRRVCVCVPPSSSFLKHLIWADSSSATPSCLSQDSTEQIFHLQPAHHLRRSVEEVEREKQEPHRITSRGYCAWQQTTRRRKMSKYIFVLVFAAVALLHCVLPAGTRPHATTTTTATMWLNFLCNYFAEHCTGTALGMESGRINDADISASSSYARSVGPEHAR